MALGTAMTTTPFSDALRQAIRARGLTLDRLRHRLRAQGHSVSLATLSYWQSGRSRPERATSLAALTELERILRVPPGELMAHLIDTAPIDIETLAEGTEAGGVFDELARRLGLTWGAGLRRVSVHETLDVAADRTEAARAARETVVATTDGIDRFPVGYHVEEAVRAASLEAFGCSRIGRVLTVLRRGIVVGEALLPRPLARGDATLVDYRFAAEGLSHPVHSLDSGSTTTVPVLHLLARFHRAAVPLWARWEQRTDAVVTGGPVVIGGTVIEHHWLAAQPGIYSLRWGFTGQDDI